MNYVILAIKQRNKYIFPLVAMCFVHNLQQDLNKNSILLRYIITQNFVTLKWLWISRGQTPTLTSQTLIWPISVKFGLNSLPKSQNLGALHLPVATSTTGVLISPWPDQEGNKLTFLSEWREFTSAPCLAGGKKNLMTARVSMLLKSRESLTCFRACFLPSAPR